MAVSVLSAADVVTTQKAAANGIQLIVIDYKPGAKYSFTPKQFRTGSGFGGDSYVKHFEAATGGALYSQLNSPTAVSYQTTASASCNIDGVIKLPSSGPYADWDTVKNMPCKVTFKVSYYVAAKGNPNLSAFVWAGPDETLPLAGEVIVHGNDLIHAKSGIATWTWSGPVMNVFGPPGTGSWVAHAHADTSLAPSGAGQASAALVCSSIVLEFPAS
jgi:hypothetical protein